MTSNEPTTDVTAVVEGGVVNQLKRMGPAWIAGAIAAGPATMAALVAAGASFQYALLWVVVLSAVFGAMAQYLAMRLGLLTEDGIVSVTDRYLGSNWGWLLVFDAVVASALAQLIIMKTLADVSATMAGFDPRAWAVLWALVLAVGLAGGGYRVLELGAKLLVGAVVVAFVLSVFVVDIDAGAAAAGLIPSNPADLGLGGALAAAGILGGAVHITLITLHSYTMRARGWTVEDYDLATGDIVGSFLIAFAAYSVAIFLVAAAVLQPDQANDALQAATALGPAVGENAQLLFLLGLWGAAISTLGANTLLPAYLLGDKLGWETDVSDDRFRGAIVVVALLSIAGGFVEGAFLPLLVIVLAFGLVGTPFALLIVLYLLNDPDAVPEGNSTAANVGGLLVVGVASVLAANFVREDALAVVDPAAGVFPPVQTFVLLFAILMALAMAGLVGKFVRDVVAATAEAEPVDS